jgi:hypothetical protein
MLSSDHFEYCQYIHETNPRTLLAVKSPSPEQALSFHQTYKLLHSHQKGNGSMAQIYPDRDFRCVTQVTLSYTRCTVSISPVQG